MKIIEHEGVTYKVRTDVFGCALYFTHNIAGDSYTALIAEVKARNNRFQITLKRTMAVKNEKYAFSKIIDPPKQTTVATLEESKLWIQKELELPFEL